MVDAFAFLSMCAIGAMLLPRALRGQSVDVRGLAFASLVAHLGASVAQVWITRGVYGGGDMLAYYFNGLELARLLRYDFGLFAPEVLKLVLQQQPLLPIHVFTGSPTATMMGLAGFLLVLVGDSLYGAVALVSLAAFFGKLSLFRGLARDCDEELHAPIFVGVMLVPSVVFWSSGLLKESIIIGPLGFMYGAFRALLLERRLASAVSLGLSSLVVALVKPYVLFAFIAAAGAFLYGEGARRAGRAATVRPVALTVTAAIAVGGVLALGQIFPEFSVEHFADSAAQHQAVGQRARGGSNYSIGDPAARSLGGQLAFAPLALVSSLYRPFVFEAHNAQSLVSALEMAGVLLLSIRALARRSWPAMWQDVLRSPMLMFCVAFTLTFALPVGLATTNLGTLTRYRMPLLPFFAAVLMIWNADLFRGVGRRRR